LKKKTHALAREDLLARAKVEETKGRRRSVMVDVNVGDVNVFTGSFACFVLEDHVLG
jgi:acyl-coenzyme A thioesterase PaaI-like protein